MPHYLTNKGKYLLMQGHWDDAGASAIKIGLLSGASIPTAIDTQAEINDFDTVAQLLGASGVAEVSAGWYSRQSLTRSNATEDDANDRVNLDAADVTWTSATAGTSIYGAFWYDATTDTSDSTRLLMGVILFSSVVATNGSNITVAIADLVRAS